MAIIGEVIYIYIYDLGGYLDPDGVGKVLRVTPEALRGERKVPTYLAIRPESLTCELPARQVNINGTPTPTRVEARVHAVGAISILFRIPFEGSLEDFLDYSYPEKLVVTSDQGRVDFRRLSAELAGEIEAKIAGCLHSTYGKETIPEEYSVFCISNLPPLTDVTQFMQGNRKLLTAILREIDDISRVSEVECESALTYSVTHSSDYLVVVDWASAVIAQTSDDYEDYLLAIELANLELLELRAFDRQVDLMIDKAYSDTRFLSGSLWPHITSPRRFSRAMADVSRMRVEMVDVLDKVMNITKFFGDYTLARLYEHLSARFHLKEWQETVSRKLEIIEGLYQVVTDRATNRQMVLLEALIVLLILFEVVMSLIRYAA